MKTIVAVIDAGGRGSALVDAYAKSPKVDELLFIPGNDLAQINTAKPVHTFQHLKTTSKDEILELCQKFKVTLVDVAQDNAVESGVSDLLRENGFKVFGPSRSAGQIEWDKAFSRQILDNTAALQPKFLIFDSEEDGIAHLKTCPDQAWFVKAYGLAEGKGALPAKNNSEAIERIKDLQKFGDSGKKYLLEDWLIGEEFSAFALCQGVKLQMLGFAQDHKRALDGDNGENTGGMGCSTPPLVVTINIAGQASEIVADTLQVLKSIDRPYQGIIYLGGIVVDGKVYVIEYNARWGDPEVECILPGIENDWYEVASVVADGGLPHINHDSKSRIVVAAASKGYPGDYSAVKGKEIKGLDKLVKTPGIKVYGAGVKIPPHPVQSPQSHPEEHEDEGSKFIANGGRLFYIVAEGKDVIEAREKAYKALKLVSIPGKNGENLLHYRTDIGYRDVKRLSST